MTSNKHDGTGSFLGVLAGSEPWWRDHSQILESRGYRLRARYQPDWVPSWLSNGRSIWGCEDHIDIHHKSTIDAMRMSDSKRVYLKRIATPSKGKEISITNFFSSGERIDDPRNHCVPIIDYFEDERIPGYGVLVTSLLRSFEEPEFVSIDEALEFISQTLEGLIFMHENNVAHRDISLANILMDERGKMYPNGFHPQYQEADVDFKKMLIPGRRRYAKGLRYVFIDFGLSSQFASQEDRQLVTGCVAADATIPELSDSIAYDPFALDVYTLGNVFREALMQKYTNLAFLSPLIEAMTREDPSTRPSAEEAWILFRSILDRKLNLLLRRRLTPIDASFAGNIYRGVASVKDEISHQLSSGSSVLCRIRARAFSSNQGPASSRPRK